MAKSIPEAADVLEEGIIVMRIVLILTVIRKGGTRNHLGKEFMKNLDVEPRSSSGEDDYC